MKVIKRDGHIVDYDKEKMLVAIGKANEEVPEEERASETEIKKIIKHIEGLNKKRILVEDIQDIIELKLMEMKKFELSKHYIVYRYNRALVRKSNTTDESILSLIRNENKELKKTIETLQTNLASLKIENSNLSKQINDINADYVEKIKQKTLEAQKIIDETKFQLNERLNDEVKLKTNVYIEKRFDITSERPT